MEDLLCQKANKSPNAIAVMDGQVSLKYSELIARADVLCQKLREKLFDSQEPICIFLESGLNQIIAQVAVLRAGGSCVPVEPSVPDMRLVDMLHDINSRYVITSKALTHRVSEFEVILVEDANEGDTPSAKNSTSSVLAGCSERHRSHILFTSGSAGKPKAVQILASSILHLVTTTPVTPLNPTDRMSSFVNPGFDLSLFEIWATLLSGATIVVIPQTIVTDPFSLGNFLQKWKVTVVIMPTALFNVICLHSPSTFHDLRHVLVVGEAANVNVMQKVLKSGAPQKLWNAYGPTETTTFSSLQLVSVDEAQRGRIGIGEPVGQTRWFLLDDQLNPITDKDQTGEICIAGPGLSQGYYNEPEANEERFICLEAQKLGEDATEHIRVYRTGDIGKWRIPLQSMDYIGRADNQIKRSGYRIELGDIERTLERNPYIKANATLYSKSEGDDSSDLLVAYVIPESWEDDFKPGDIINWAKERLLHYMVPDRVIRLREFPLTPRGKVDRNALNDNYHDTFREQKAEKAHIDPQERDPQTGDLSSWLKSTLQNSLDVSHFDIRDNFSLTGSPLCQLPG